MMLNGKIGYKHLMQQYYGLLFKRVGKNGRPNQSKINLLTNLVTKQINISYWYRS